MFSSFRVIFPSWWRSSGSFCLLKRICGLIKKIKAVVWKGREKEVDDEQPRSKSPQTAECSEANAVGGKNWSERFTTYMANAGDKVWRKILKALQVMGDDDDSLDDVNDVKQVLKEVGVGQQLVEELQDALYDQLTQYIGANCLADIQLARPGITSKHETKGHKSSTLKQVMFEAEKIIQREKDRKASRKDRKSVGGKKIAFAG